MPNKNRPIAIAQKLLEDFNFNETPPIEVDQIADFLMDSLKPQGAAVVLEASHSCMTIRGIQKPGSVMVTSALRGIFRRDPKSRSEVLSLMHK